MADKLISDYIGAGLIANRPAAPDVVAGVAAFYQATDTGVLSVWDGSIWTDLSEPTLTIVQKTSTAASNINDGITLSAAPTEGNLLVGMVNGDVTNTPGAGSGWIRGASGGGTSNNHGWYYKIAGGSESTNQAPASSSATGNIFMWEFANAKAAMMWPFAGQAATGSLTTWTFDVSLELSKILSSGLILGCVSRSGGSAILPDSFSGGYSLGMAEPVGTASKATQTFEIPVSAGAPPSTGTITYSTSASTGRGWVIVV